MHIIFLPGGGGAAEFWQPLGALLPADWKKTYMSWPGLGIQPHDPAVNGFDDLVALVEKEIHGPCVLVAQSMGTVVAIRLLARHPDKITHLVLTASSGGVDMDAFGSEEWRPGYLKTFPDGARWITIDKPDHTADIRNIACPALLLWSDVDPNSPLGAGKHFSALIKHSQLRIIEGGSHAFANERANEIAPMVVEHLTRRPA